MPAQDLQLGTCPLIVEKGRSPFCNDGDIRPFRKPGVVKAKEFPHQPLDPIAFNRSPDLSAHRNSEPCGSASFEDLNQEMSRMNFLPAVPDLQIVPAGTDAPLGRVLLPLLFHRLFLT